MQYNEKSPSGWTGTVKAMKLKHGDKIDNPYALAHYLKNKGYKSHYKDVKSSKGTRVPAKKEKYKDDKNESHLLTFKEWILKKEKSIVC